MELLDVITDIPVLLSLILAIFSSYVGKLGSFIVNGIGSLPSKFKRVHRIRKINKIRKYLLIAINPYDVTWHIVRTYFYLTMFIMCIFFYIIFIKIGSFGNISGLPTQAQHLIYSPIYIFEVLWIVQRDFTRGIIQMKHVRERKKLKSRISRKGANKLV